MTTTVDRTVEDIEVGEELPEVALPLTVYRLVMAAGSNRDFNSIHHNTEYARSTGAQEMYANTGFLLAAWERFVRTWAGDGATLLSIRKFRMRSFNYVGDTMFVRGRVMAVDDDVVTVEVRCENSSGVTVGPGQVSLRLPRRGPA
jgi:acyl dehydratase